jgi:ketosteroid isomerase-like protein
MTDPNTRVLDDASLAERMLADAQLVRRAYDAVHDGRQDLLAGYFAPDFVLVQSPSHLFPGEYHGLADAAACLARTFRVVGMARSEVRQIAADGLGTAFVVYEMIWADGSTMQLLELVRLHEGRIIEVRPFAWDPSHMTELRAAREQQSPEESGTR